MAFWSFSSLVSLGCLSPPERRSLYFTGDPGILINLDLLLFFRSLEFGGGSIGTPFVLGRCFGLMLPEILSNLDDLLSVILFAVVAVVVELLLFLMVL